MTQADLEGRGGSGGARSRPSPEPGEGEWLIEQIVSAVKAGDDPQIRRLLTRLAAIADVPVLLELRQRLYDDRPG
ncbi:hypothetical protein [Streptomyces sp. NPDC101132]|uniref:hypothetical protein n=1 Tax=Streptomyces sp. NPDC101132 TaxID=3366110 RepID=UPI0037F36375